MAMIDDRERAYAAGFFDGEGCITISMRRARRGAKEHHTLLVSVSQCDLRPLNWLRERFGGSISPSNSKIAKARGYRQAYRLCLAGAKADRFLSEIQPFAIVKREQIDLAIEFRGTTRRRGDLVPVKVASDREGMRAKMRLLKRGA
jgi:hypothetical protein